MEKFKVSVLVQDDHELFGNNDFVKGKIVGYMECICNTFNEERVRISARQVPGIGRIITTETTIDEYSELKARIDKHYRGLCKFGIVKVEK